MKLSLIALAAVLAFAACNSDNPTDPVQSNSFAKSSRPLKSRWEGTNTRGTGCAPAPYTNYSYAVYGDYAGQTTHFGSSTADLSTCMVATSSTGGTLAGTFEIVAANGDKVYGTATGGWSLVTLSPFKASIWGEYEITGGTGRFEGATGSGNVTAGQDGGWSNEDNTAWMEFDGTIDY